MATSNTPYDGIPVEGWAKLTSKLIKAHPLSADELVNTVLKAWTELHVTRIGSRELQIGKDIFPNPQILGFLLHELIPVELAALHPKQWRREKTKGEKDLVYELDPHFSVEIKTSSHPSQIFGNRSYAQHSTAGLLACKAKGGYFLTVNFQIAKQAGDEARVTRIRFGWLDPSDWIGQQSQTGQQSRLTAYADRYKLVQLYPALAKTKLV